MLTLPQDVVLDYTTFSPQVRVLLARVVAVGARQVALVTVPVTEYGEEGEGFADLPEQMALTPGMLAEKEYRVVKGER
jgi:hypothetical protein